MRITEITRQYGFNACLRMDTIAKPVRALALSAGSALMLGLSGCGVSPPVGWLTKDLKMPSGGFFCDFAYLASHVPPLDYQIGKCALISLITAKVVSVVDDNKTAWIPGLITGLVLTLGTTLVDDYFFRKAFDWTPDSMMGSLSTAFFLFEGIGAFAGIGLGYLYNAFQKKVKK